MSKKQVITIGLRASRLASVQADEIQAMMANKGIRADFDRKIYTTRGDRDKITPLTAGVADNFFTDALDAALLEGAIDLAVHSAKDLPEVLGEGLSIFALTAALDDTDAFLGNMPFHQLPAGARIGTSSEIRRKAIKGLKPDAQMIDIRGTIEERIGYLQRGECDGIIAATAALKRLGLEGQIKDTMAWEPAPLQGQLAVVGRSSDIALRILFSAIDVRRTYGRVSLVGAGPGDPDLITMKGIKALREADCVFYDYLAHQDLLSYAVYAEKIYAGKRKGEQALSQDELSRQLKAKAFQGKRVVRLKGGDPLIFGRGAEEIGYLRSFHIKVDVIPGVSSATAIPSSLAVPLTARHLSSSVAFISGHGKDERDGAAVPVEIPKVDTVVFLMGLTKLDEILAALGKAGWDQRTPVLVISKGTCEDERIIDGTLSSIASRVREAGLEPPAVIIAGPTAGLWRPAAPEGGWILYTGAENQPLQGWEDVIHLPMIRLSEAALSLKERRMMIKSFKRSPMVLLTSRFAVKYFFDILRQEGYDGRGLKDKDFLAIGPSTARALRVCGVEPALTAQVPTSEGFLEAIVQRYDVKGKNIFFPRSALSNPYLQDALAGQGAVVQRWAVYENVKPAFRPLPKERIAAVYFTSPSTVKNFLADYGALPQGWRIISQGPATSRCLKEAGIAVSEEVYKWIPGAME